MATITKYRKRNGELSYRAQVRVKENGKIIFSASRSFPKESLARDWAKRVEVRAAEDPEYLASGSGKSTKLTVGDALKRYKTELEESGGVGRTKGYVLDLLQRCTIADRKLTELEPKHIIEHCRDRIAEGTGPATVSHDVSYLRTMLEHAGRVWQLRVSTKCIDDATPTLRSQNLISKSRRRDRRPIDQELTWLIEALEKRQGHRNAKIPHVAILRFAIATTMRLGEVGRLLWSDLDEKKRCIMIRQRKDPSNRYTNDQVVPLLGDAFDIVMAQPRIDDRIFPYNMKSVSAGFQRVCQEYGIADLRFHDMRHEGTSRLFEAHYGIHEVSIVTGHKSWANLKRYTQIMPEQLHAKASGIKQVIPTRPIELNVGHPLVAGVSGALFMGGVSSIDDVSARYDLAVDDIAGVQMIFACDLGEQGACVAFVEAGELYLVHNPDGGRDWLPERTSLNRLRHRVLTGKLGGSPKGANTFGRQLLEAIQAVI